MTSSDAARGIVYTFYSYKGGAGRTMALVNVATLLTQWGHKVLIVDWDLEAPGVENFFVDDSKSQTNRSSYPGVVDLIESQFEQKQLNWRECLVKVDSKLSIITAGRDDGRYIDRLQRMDFEGLFEAHNFGAYLEAVRTEWISDFDFVLIDSRTGITDIGGICTVHLPDILVMFFTASASSVEGTIKVVDRARIAQERLPLNRGRLLAVPIPSRDESRTEYERAETWKHRFAERFDDYFRDWLPSGVSSFEAVEALKIPHVPYWSFGENITVTRERPNDPATLSYSYQLLARLLAGKLDWYEAIRGRSLAPPTSRKPRELDINWLKTHRTAAMNGLKTAKRQGFMEAFHYSLDPVPVKMQDELLAIAKQAMVHTFGWPVGVVLGNRPEFRPKPTQEGIVADLDTDHDYDYWTLTKTGDFYTLMSLFEDTRTEGNELFFNTRIVRVTEVIVHCLNLYKAFGADPSVRVALSVAHGGLRNRRLTATRSRFYLESDLNQTEDEISSSVTFAIGISESEIVDLVKQLCEPLFLMFNFTRYPDSLYSEIVIDYINGKAT